MTSSTTDMDDPASEDRPRGAGQLLADRRFGPYVVGQWLSNTGNWFHNVAIGIVIFQATGSSTLVGLVGGLQYAFTLFLAPWAGQLSDRLDRRRLLVGAQLSGLGGAVGLAILLAFVDPTPGLVWPIALFTGFIGAGYAIGLPTLQAGLVWSTSLLESNGVLSVAAVPLPSAVWLLLSALVGMYTLRRADFGRFPTLYKLSMANSQSPRQQPLKPSAAIISPGVMFEPGWRASP